MTMKKTKTRKIYRALRYKGLSVQITIGGQSQLVSFIHANPTSGENAYLVTDDPEMHAALESSPAYGTDFYLERQTNYETEVPDIPQPIMDTERVKEDGSVADAASTTTEAEPAEERPMSPEEGITNAATAKAYLMDKFEDEKLTIVGLKRADEVRAFAKEKGIVFPNWE